MFVLVPEEDAAVSVRIDSVYLQQNGRQSGDPGTSHRTYDRPVLGSSQASHTFLLYIQRKTSLVCKTIKQASMVFSDATFAN